MEIGWLWEEGDRYRNRGRDVAINIRCVWLRVNRVTGIVIG